MAPSLKDLTSQGWLLQAVLCDAGDRVYVVVGHDGIEFTRTSRLYCSTDAAHTTLKLARTRYRSRTLKGKVENCLTPTENPFGELPLRPNETRDDNTAALVQYLGSEEAYGWRPSVHHLYYVEDMFPVDHATWPHAGWANARFVLGADSSTLTVELAQPLH